MKTRDSSIEESDLVRRIREGKKEIELYRLLVDRYSPMIFAMTHRFAAHPADAEDLAQDIFLKAYDSLDRFKLGTDFRAWIYTLGVNLCRDYAKNVRRSVYPMSQMGEDEYKQLVSEAPSQDRELEQREWAERARHMRPSRVSFDRPI